MPVLSGRLAEYKNVSVLFGFCERKDTRKDVLSVFRPFQKKYWKNRTV